MTDPKRWSDGDSEIDPVLRSVLRYAKDFAPTAGETQSLLRRVRAAEEERAAFSQRPLVSRKRRGVGKSAAVGLALGAALGGVAWAGYATFVMSPRPAEPAATAVTVAAGRALPASRPGPLTTPVPATSAAEPEAVLPDPVQPEKGRESARAASAQSAAPVEASLQSDAELLQLARTQLRADPGDSLRLTREHAQRFPNSPLMEERSALGVEALLRLGRNVEAESAMRRFDADYPRSPYRRRLRALLPE